MQNNYYSQIKSLALGKASRRDSAVDAGVGAAPGAGRAVVVVRVQTGAAGNGNAVAHFPSCLLHSFSCLLLCQLESEQRRLLLVLHFPFLSFVKNELHSRHG